MKELKTTSTSEIEFYAQLEKYFDNSIGSTLDKLSNFTKYVPRQDLTVFLAKYEIFKKVLSVKGVIIECGVFLGGGLMTFAKLSSILEPTNHRRKIIGFDTFSGFPGITKSDKGSSSDFARKKGLAVDSYKDLQKCISLFDLNRFIGHIPKVNLVKGDISKTAPKFLRDNPQTVVSLLYLDADIYKPTKVALKEFLPRMPKGAIVAFDELDNDNWVGETVATIESIGLHKLRIERSIFEPNISYAVLE